MNSFTYMAFMLGYFLIGFFILSTLLSMDEKFKELTAKEPFLGTLGYFLTMALWPVLILVMIISMAIASVEKAIGSK